MKKAIDALLLVLGLALALAGFWWMWTGWDIVQAERGWASVIAGSVMLSGGLITFAIAWSAFSNRGAPVVVASAPPAFAPPVEVAPRRDAAIATGMTAVAAGAAGAFALHERASSPEDQESHSPLEHPSEHVEQGYEEEPAVADVAWRAEPETEPPLARRPTLDELVRTAIEERPDAPVDPDRASEDRAEDVTWREPIDDATLASLPSDVESSTDRAGAAHQVQFPFAHDESARLADHVAHEPLRGPVLPSEAYEEPTHAAQPTEDASSGDEAFEDERPPVEPSEEQKADRHTPSHHPHSLDAQEHDEAPSAQDPNEDWPAHRENDFGPEAEAARHTPEHEPEPSHSQHKPPSITGRYSSGDTNYIMYDDGSIEAQTPDGVMRFASLLELRRFVEQQT
ncbi:MAG: hypothetical protein KGM42_13250 [Hyphomicrobiales bacterium]|nr:hypothetical protein [Hyphomicrobiales bacterium]